MENPESKFCIKKKKTKEEISHTKSSMANNQNLFNSIVSIDGFIVLILLTRAIFLPSS